jgi:hypothetical protein
MDNLPTWAVWIAAVAVGISPGLAILSTPTIARLLHRFLWPRPEVAPKPERDEAAGVAATPRRADGLLTASMLDSRVSVVGR